MRRTLTLATAAALLTVAGCASTTTSTSSDAAPTSTGVEITANATAVATTADEPTSAAAAPTRTASPKPKKPRTTPKECDPGPDVIVWYRVATLQDQAQRLGSRGYPNCSSTFTMIQNTSPSDAGDCTEAAWASDNPGYNADATPAKRLKKVKVSVGPAC